MAYLWSKICKYHNFSEMNKPNIEITVILQAKNRHIKSNWNRTTESAITGNIDLII